MSSIDDVIRERLEKLRADSPSSSAPKASTSGILPTTVKKSAAEQVESLLAQLSQESSIDKKIAPDLDIDSQLRSRLERLRSREGCEFVSNKHSREDKKEITVGIDDEDYFIKSSPAELLADLEGDDSCSEESDISENLCVVCDEKKPALVCLGCDKDCFCSKCFKEFHSDDEGHRTVPYVKKL